MLELRSVSKIYDQHSVVTNLTLSIKKGTVFGFLGPNGAGKSTTIKMIVGLLKPTNGSIRIDNKSTEDPSTREIIGFMPEEPHFYDRLTGMEFMLFSGGLFKNSRKKMKKDYERILERAGILEAKDQRIREYSKGMKQRLGFAQALVNNPDYIFLDEPLEGLDPLGRQDLKKTILELRNAGKTFFFNSHILSDVENICDEIGIINRGKLIYSGRVADFNKGLSLEEQFVKTIRQINE
jgi:ABC-2 type transport system ATP-binding protein